MKKYFISFADSRMQKSLDRITMQAKALEFFDKIHVYNEKNLSLNFREKFGEKLKKGSIGYGFWVWKPQIILQELELMDEGDILIYVDGGFHIRKEGRKRLEEYLEMVNKAPKGILGFAIKPLLDTPQEKSFLLPNYQWTKGDLFDYFNVRDKKDITHAQTFGAGIVLIKKCSESVGIIQQWLQVFETDFNLVDNTPSKSPNFPGFIDHRHDQAVVSILFLLNNIESVSAFEYYYPSKRNKWRADWKMIKDYPFWAKRDKDLGFWKNILFLYTKINKRLRREWMQRTAK